MMEGVTLTGFVIALAIVLFVVIVQVIARIADVADAGWIS